MSKFGFNKLAKRIETQVQPVLDHMANNAVNFFKVDVFEAQGFIDETVQRWPGRKSKRDNAGRKLLVKSGKGRASIKVLSRSKYSRRVGTAVPYMELHNVGTSRLPKRQFIGQSRRLERQNLKLLNRFLQSVK